MYHTCRKTYQLRNRADTQDKTNSTQQKRTLRLLCYPECEAGFLSEARTISRHTIMSERDSFGWWRVDDLDHFCIADLLLVSVGVPPTRLYVQYVRSTVRV